MTTSRIAQTLLDLMLGVPNFSRHQWAWKITFFVLGIARRATIVLLGDPTIRYCLDGKKLLMPLSHELPLIRRKFPGYSSNIARITATLRLKYPDMSMVDIGANIGDTVAIVRSLSGTVPILCIDGDSHFFSYLRENTSHDKAVELENCFVGDNQGLVAGHIEAIGGTGRIVVNNGSSNRIETKRLSSLLEAHPTFHAVKLIKIDTDGFDTKIIKGESILLKAWKPVVFLEYDPFFFCKNDKDGFGIFAVFREAGYAGALFFENTGELLASVDLNDKRLLEDLHQFYSGRNGQRYCDVCVFPSEDVDVMEKIRIGERNLAGLNA